MLDVLLSLPACALALLVTVLVVRDPAATGAGPTAVAATAVPLVLTSGTAAQAAVVRLVLTARRRRRWPGSEPAA